MAIKSFRCKDTQTLFERSRVRRFTGIEALRGDRKGQHSIRINDQFRLCFRWQGTDAIDVEIVDYH